MTMVSNIFHNKAYPRRGEIYYIKKGNTTCTGSEMWSDRHAVIVSDDNINRYSNVVQVVYITTQPKKIRMPVHVDITEGDLTRTILCEQVTPVDKSRIAEFKGRLSAEQMKSVAKAITTGLSLNKNQDNY